jgi:hypothetical protein
MRSSLKSGLSLLSISEDLDVRVFFLENFGGFVWDDPLRARTGQLIDMPRFPLGAPNL